MTPDLENRPSAFADRLGGPAGCLRGILLQRASPERVGSLPDRAGAILFVTASVANDAVFLKSQWE